MPSSPVPVADQPTSAPPVPLDPYKMSDDQIRLMIARENLARFGSVYAPPGVTFDAAPIAVPHAGEVRVVEPRTEVRRAKVVPDPKWFKLEKKCPHCGETKNVGRDFGVMERKRPGDGAVVQYAVGWCRDCRNKTNYHKAPRKNKTRG